MNIQPPLSSLELATNSAGPCRNSAVGCSPTGISRVHGQEQETAIAGRCVLLYPLYHPAAALYTPAMLKVLESDFARLPELLGREPAAAVEAAAPEPELAPLVAEPAVQLGLF